MKELDEACPQCGNPLQLKQGAFGMFMAVAIIPIVILWYMSNRMMNNPLTAQSAIKGHLVVRRGRQGKIFYGCDNFPIANFPCPQKPHVMPCPQCHFPLALLKVKMPNTKCGNVQIKLSTYF